MQYWAYHFIGINKIHVFTGFIFLWKYQEIYLNKSSLESSILLRVEGILENQSLRTKKLIVTVPRGPVRRQEPPRELEQGKALI